MYQLSTRVDFPEQVCCDTADLIIYATLLYELLLCYPLSPPY